MMNEIRVDGRRLERDLTAFEQECLGLIADEIYTFDPDMTLVDLLADAVRLAREHAECPTQDRKEA
jgi:hypothetical protein